MYRRRTLEIMNKCIKDKSEVQDKRKTTTTSCDAGVSNSTSTTTGTSGFLQIGPEVGLISNENFSVATVPMWREENVVIENFTGEPEVGLVKQFDIFAYETHDKIDLITAFDVGLNDEPHPVDDSVHNVNNIIVDIGLGLNDEHDPDVAVTYVNNTIPDFDLGLNGELDPDVSVHTGNVNNTTADFDLALNDAHEPNVAVPDVNNTIPDFDLGLNGELDPNVTVHNVNNTRPRINDVQTKKGTARKRKLCGESKEDKDKKKQKCLQEKHVVLPPCENTCVFKCTQNLSYDQRCNLNHEFWKKSWIDRRSYVLTTCERLETKRKTAGAELNSKRTKTFQYFLLGEEGKKVRVCKKFFLTTLGYHEKNDRFIFEALSKTPKSQISPVLDKRGKRTPANYIPKDEIISHILSFQPEVAHYRREHAPKTLYLPSDINVTLMHNDFLEKHPESKCSYDVYRCQVKKMKISFAKLGHEECETCEQFKLHGHKQNNLIPECQECQNWTKHINAAKESRELYRKQKQITDPNTLVVSADLQKIIMLPRVETFKKVLFTKRLVAYHESFVPTGDKPSAKPFAVVWHEAIAGRNKEDLISTFYAFLKHNRDFKHIIIWLDNCSSQNKNWCLYTFLVQIINSNEISCETVEINYFEAGHTFMSADSFHHNVEQSLKREGKVYDFQDFVSAVKNARSDVDVKEMTVSDFHLWTDLTSQHKLKKDPNRTYMADIVQVGSRF